MKICIACKRAFFASTWQCIHCGYEPPFEDGFRILAPDIEGDRSYDERFHCRLAELEAACFWFRNRNHLIQSAVRRFFPNAQSFFEIGCGTGFVLAFLAKEMPMMRLTAGDLYPSGLRFVATRQPSTELLQVDARHLPFQAEFDLIGAFDVIEHIDDDQSVLEQVHRALKPGGGVVITVPQHQWLWTQQDIDSYHRRRYTRGKLLEQIRAAGLKPLWATSFVSFLLPLMVLRRLRHRMPFGRQQSCDPIDEVQIGRFADRVLGAICKLEGRWIGRCQRSLPIGGSLLIVAMRTP